MTCNKSKPTCKLPDDDDEMLPAGWIKCWSTRKGRAYYFNLSSAESSWERPTDLTDTKLQPRQPCQVAEEDEKVVSRKRSADSLTSCSGSGTSLSLASLERPRQQPVPAKLPCKRPLDENDNGSNSYGSPLNKTESESTSPQLKVSKLSRGARKRRNRKLRKEENTKSEALQKEDASKCLGSKAKFEPATPVSKLTNSKGGLVKPANTALFKTVKETATSNKTDDVQLFGSRSPIPKMAPILSPTSPPVGGANEQICPLATKRMAMVQSWVDSLNVGGKASAVPAVKKSKKKHLSDSAADPLQCSLIEDKTTDKENDPGNKRPQGVDPLIVCETCLVGVGQADTPGRLSRSLNQEEDMEVDYSVDREKLLGDIQGVRKSLKREAVEKAIGQLTEKVLSSPESKAKKKCTSQTLTVVVDTNVLLEELTFVDELKDLNIGDLGRPTVVIPWVVLQELDALKDSKAAARRQLALRTQAKARSAVNYVHNCLENNHPRVVGQSPVESSIKVPELNVECNDDRLLVSCLQTKKHSPSAKVILFTLDKNLRNKAMVLGLQTYSKESLLTWIKHKVSRNNVTNAHGTGNSSQAADKIASCPKPPTIDNKAAEIKLADQVLCELKSQLRSSLSIVMESEMKNVYDDLWYDILFKKPPWTCPDLLDCFNKHWIAVFGLILPRNFQSSIHSLRAALHPTAAFGQSLRQAVSLLKDGTELCELLRNHSKYNGALDEPIETLGELYRLCQNVLNGQYITSDIEGLKLQAQGLPLPQEPAISTRDQSNTATTSGDESFSILSAAANARLQEDETAVKTSFQVIWEGIMYFRECFELRLSVETDEATLQHRLETVEFFAKFCAAVADINTFYAKMLDVDPIQVNSQLSVFCKVCFALNNFAQKLAIEPWQPINGFQLKNFYLQVDNRAILHNGYKQLQEFMLGIMGCHQSLLSVQERTSIEAYCRNASSIS